MSQKLSWVARVAGVVAVVGMLAAAGIAYAQPTFSQANVTVGVGQSTTVTSESGTAVYLEANPASNVVSVSVNGTQIALAGLSPGSATLNICNVGTASDCTNLYVTVQTGVVSSSSGLSFSQNNLSLSISAEQSVTVSGGNGTYSISSNSNTTVVSTSLSGNTLTITGLASGDATITVCDTSNTNTCGTLSVAVGSSGTSGLSFSPSSVSLTAEGSNQTVIVSGGNGTYNISNNSNSSIASVGLASTGGIIVDAVGGSGSATITVCDTSDPSICGTLPVTVGSGSTTTTSNGNQAVTFSVANPTLAVGQTLSISLSGGASSYVLLSNTTPNVVQANMTSGVTLSLYGEVAGTDTLVVCATGGSCTPLNVTVTGASTATTTATPTTTTTAPTTTATVTTTGTVVANAALLAEIQTLQTAVTQTLAQIETIQSQINQIEAQVSAGSGSGVNMSAGGVSASSAAGAYNFTELLSVGSEDAQVTELQQDLTSLGFYSGPVTGYYGTLTEQAVMKYQTAHGIEATGELGPETRAALNG